VLPHEVIPAALRAGLVTVEDAVGKGVLAEPIGVSHPVWRLSVGGEARFALKVFGPRRGETDGEIAREAAVLALAAERPAVAALVPRVLPWTGPEPVLATGLAPGASLMAGEHPDAAWPALVAALAAPLAALHRATRDLAAPGAPPHPVLAGAEPWGLRLFDGDAPAELWAAPALAPVLAAVAAEPGVVPALRRARGAWRVLCLLHGDLKQDNVLLDAAADPPRATIVDWEMARLGDPAWDVAGLAARLLLAAPPEEPWTPGNVAALAAWLSAYAAAAGLPVPALAQRAVMYGGAWLLMTALQHASTLPPAQAFDGAKPMLAAARAALLGAEAATARVLDAAAAAS
jgi:Ser/Thr protein kinase RdoA (MazF antagonist)